MPGKVLIIGLDGADWRLLKPYLDDGVMPNLAGMVETGISGPLRSTIPTNSSVAWNSFMTGRNPGRHGVFDFTQRSPSDPLRMVGVNSRTRRCDTFYDTLGRHGKRAGSINVPITYPAFPINGFMLGGMIVQEGRPFTYPESLAAELAEKVGGFPVNKIRWRYMLGRMDALLDEALVVTQQRARVLEYLIDRGDWDVLVQVFVSPDRLQHPLMHLLDPEHLRHDRALAHRLAPKIQAVFKAMDDVIGRSRRQLGDEDTLMIISDHGFRSVHKAIYVRDILARHGLLRAARPRGQNRLTVRQVARKVLRPLLPSSTYKAIARAVPSNGNGKMPVGSPQEMANLIWQQTQAYATTVTSQAVYANLAGREPFGVVSQGVEYERLLNRVEEILLAERDPQDGSQVIEAVIRVKDFYSGEWVPQAPDLLFVPAKGYAAAKGAPAHLQPYEWFMGDHAMDGILAAAGAGVKRGARIQNASLMDIAPTALYLTGTPIPSDMDGRVLDLFADHRLIMTPPQFETAQVSYQSSAYDYTPEE